MKQISLRKFRDSIPLLREVVAVSRRDSEGNYQILGTWTPREVDEPTTVTVARPYRTGDFGEAVVSGFGESRPAPKPGKPR